MWTRLRFRFLNWVSVFVHLDFSRLPGFFERYPYTPEPPIVTVLLMSTFRVQLFGCNMHPGLRRPWMFPRHVRCNFDIGFTANEVYRGGLFISFGVQPMRTK